MNNILFSADKTATSSLVSTALRTLGTMSTQGRNRIGALDADWCARASITGGGVDLSTPGVVRLQNLTLEFTFGIGFCINLAEILPPPKRKSAKSPVLNLSRICHSDRVRFANDFKTLSALHGDEWHVGIEMVNFPDLHLEAIVERFHAHITVAIKQALRDVSGAKPHLNDALGLVAKMMTVDDLAEFIRPVLDTYLKDLNIPLYSQPRTQSAIPPCFRSGNAPQIRIDDLCANVVPSNGGALVLSADICHI